jgi:hypothetical protein
MITFMYLLNALVSRIFSKIGRQNPFNDSFDLDQHALRFRRELKPNTGIKRSTKQIILIEANQIPSNQLALAITIPTISKYFNAKPVAFRVGATSNLQKFRQIFRHNLSMLRAVGAERILIIKKMDNSPTENASKDFEVYTKEDLENFTLDGVYLGDLIYDEYLSSTHSATVNFEDLKFQQIFLAGVNYVRSWEKIFSKGNVNAICIWHDVYFYALPARVAFKFNVPVFSVTTRGVYRLTPEWPHVGLNPVKNDLLKVVSQVSGDSRGKFEIFSETGDENKSLELNQINLSDSFKNNKRKKIRVLIANHIFFDAPHCYGKMFYPDFEVWLTKLSEIAQETDYSWFLKPHPHAPFWKENNLIELFSKRNPNFKLLPIEISKEDIERLGIDFVLTVHGTASLHYAGDGYRVINASINNPYNKYSFSFTPDSREQYEEVIRNLEKFNYKFKFSEVAEYVEHISRIELENWLFKNHSNYFEHFKAANDAMSTQSYSYYLDSENSRKLPEVERALIKFLSSGDLNLNYNHYKD